MKKLLVAAICMAAISLTITSCDSKKEKGKERAETGKPASGESTTTSEPSADKKGMTVAEAKSFLDADEANKGKEVTVSAYSWGNNDRMGGEVQINLGDKKLEGMQSASFSAIFGKDAAAAVKAIQKDAMVTISGKIAKGAGGVELTDCKIVE